MEKQQIITLLLTIFSGVGGAIASEKIDSLSYAMGHQYTLGTMAGKNDLMLTEADFQNYIRGLEENCRNVSHMNDSSYMMSYCLGAMEAVFITDAMHGKKKEELPPFSCIIAGLRKVRTGEITLPADTMADRKAFATGMADVLEAYTDAPKSAYDLGRMVALSLNIGAMEKDSPDIDSFVAGAKGALGLGKEFILREEAEEILNRRYAQEYEATRPVDDNAQFETMMEYYEYYDSFDVEFDTSYSIDWDVTAGTVADERAEAYHAFIDLVTVLEIDKNCIPGILMAQVHDTNGLICDTALVEIEKYSLPVGYKWFCGRNVDSQTTIGVMRTEPLFKADIHKASVVFDPMSGMVNVEWKFDTDDAQKWAEFTAANIGKHVAMEIDGVYMFAPMVNMQISGGACAISSLRPEEINRLFKNAKKVENQTPVDTIELIEIN